MKTNIVKLVGVQTLLIFAALLFGGSSANAAVDTCTWTGGGADNNLLTTGNWSCSVDGAAAVPEDGDALVFDVSVLTEEFSNTIITNDLVGATFTSIDETGSRADGVYSGFELQGNDFTLSGNATSTIGLNVFGLDIALSANDLVLERIYSDGMLAISSNNVELRNYSRFDSGFSGSGTLTFNNEFGAGGGGGCSYGDVVESADNTGFSGPVILEGSSSLTLNGREGNIANNASMITVGEDAFLSVVADNDKDLEIDTNLTFNGGTVSTYQNFSNEDCDEPEDFVDVTFSGDVIVSSDVTVRSFFTNTIFSGDVIGSGEFDLQDGLANPGTLTVGDEVQESEKIVETVEDEDEDAYLDVFGNKEITFNGIRESGGVGNGGVLKGTGEFTGRLSVNEDGTIAPGLSPGCMTVGTDFTLYGTYEFEIDGTDACDEYDQIIVDGEVRLDDSDFSGSNQGVLQLLRDEDFIPEVGDEFILIRNASSDEVIGQFDGRDEGDEFEVDGVTYQISYEGGDGNDVSVTVTEVDVEAPGAPDTGVGLLMQNPFITLSMTALAAGVIVGLRKVQSSIN